MPAHVRAADAPEDLWRCHECGWTYPNHHPSAKHRRNHKKQCGKLPGYVKTTDSKASPQVATGSSDDGSSDEERHRVSLQGQEKNGHHQELPQSLSPSAAANVEQVSRGYPIQNRDGGAPITPKVESETDLSTRNLNLSTSKGAAETANGSVQGQSRVGSAHSSKGQWTCRHCGWAYPNAHPSAKNRRKHKKICGTAAAHVGAGGSSDEASSDEEKSSSGNESNEYMKTQEPLECTAGGARGALDAEMVNRVGAKAIDPSQVVEERAFKDDRKEIPSEPDSSKCQVSFGATSVHRVSGINGQGKPDTGVSCAAQVDEGDALPTEEQAPSTLDIGEPPTPPTDEINSSQTQLPDDISNCTVPNGKPHLPQPPRPIPDRENDGKSMSDQKKGDSGTVESQSPVPPATNTHRDSVGSPSTEMKSRQPNSAARAGFGGESVTNFEQRTPPQSPEGLVRSRVQIFEKLASTSPQYLRKSVSPNTNSASPRLPRGYHLQNSGATDTNGSDSPGQKLSTERGTQPTSKHDGLNELQEVMSHLRHRGNFVQSECNELPLERA